ncbi:hypothetical protein D9758_009646 [Tetrapyrgos nigripes]|uniref:DUF7726 domain-containing protein n=1 Tax=Tetrapyrgos nigripes TaxID=182062 RepID=A0A8H5CPR5_9AGAR|nr:hypothetical protein D9758_009646 [Tetrapyrgos nigripes]
MNHYFKVNHNRLTLSKTTMTRRILRSTSQRDRDNDNTNAPQTRAGQQKTSSKRKRDINENDALNASKPPLAKRKKHVKASTKAHDRDSDHDLFSIDLKGDEDGTVPIFDSCDVIREKIDDHLSETGVTKAQFLRNIARAAYPNNVPTIQTKQLNDFMRWAGATTGNSNRVFYAAYVYFEKKRISEGKSKSEHRKKMEKQWAHQGGMSRELCQYYWCRDGVELYEDEVGVRRSVKDRRT